MKALLIALTATVAVFGSVNANAYGETLVRTEHLSSGGVLCIYRTTQGTLISYQYPNKYYCPYVPE